MFLKWFGISILAFPISHAWRVWIQSTTGTMHHEAFQGFKQSGLGIRIRPLGTDYSVDDLRCEKFMLALQKNKKVHVG